MLRAHGDAKYSIKTEHTGVKRQNTDLDGETYLCDDSGNQITGEEFANMLYNIYANNINNFKKSVFVIMLLETCFCFLN